jgi:hypothetical protein
LGSGICMWILDEGGMACDWLAISFIAKAD